jgi:hypothetical protein
MLEATTVIVVNEEIRDSRVIEDHPVMRRSLLVTP